MWCIKSFCSVILLQLNRRIRRTFFFMVSQIKKLLKQPKKRFIVTHCCLFMVLRVSVRRRRRPTVCAALSVLGRQGGWGREEEWRMGWQKERVVCPSWSTSSLMLAHICLGWKLSTRLEYWWLLLCISRLHLPPFLPLFHLTPLFH